LEERNNSADLIRTIQTPEGLYKIPYGERERKREEKRMEGGIKSEAL
jgi:hypothetical protein